jgi:hypothetical protein
LATISDILINDAKRCPSDREGSAIPEIVYLLSAPILLFSDDLPFKGEFRLVMASTPASEATLISRMGMGSDHNEMLGSVLRIEALGLRPSYLNQLPITCLKEE